MTWLDVPADFYDFAEDTEDIDDDEFGGVDEVAPLLEVRRQRRTWAQSARWE